VFAAPQVSHPDSDVSGIVGGAEDAHHEAVVALVALPLACGALPAAVCTGTVIAPRVVLTAAHCLALLPPGGGEVVVDRNVDATAARHIQIVQRLPHPEWVAPFHDVALVEIGEDAGIAPAVLTETTDAAWLSGHLVTLVGYGRDEHGRTGTRRFGTARVLETTSQHLRVEPEPALSCAGDSGGPALAVVAGIERVVGVASYGDPGCAAVSTYARLDLELSGFVMPGLERLQRSSDPARLPAPNQCDVACRVDSDCPTAWQCMQGRCGLHGRPPGRLAGQCSTDAECPGGTCVVTDDCSCYQPCETASSIEGGCTCAFGRHAAGHPTANALTILMTLLCYNLRRKNSSISAAISSPLPSSAKWPVSRSSGDQRSTGAIVKSSTPTVAPPVTITPTVSDSTFSGTSSSTAVSRQSLDAMARRETGQN
jgi:hypothetical protein